MDSARFLRNRPDTRIIEEVQVVKRWVFDCVLCGKTYYLSNHSLMEDGNLACWNCNQEWPPLWWCAGCERALDSDEFKGRWGFESRCAKCQRSTPLLGGPELQAECIHCGETFSPKYKNGRYCSGRCRVAAHRARKAAS